MSTAAKSVNVFITSSTKGSFAFSFIGENGADLKNALRKEGHSLDGLKGYISINGTREDLTDNTIIPYSSNIVVTFTPDKMANGK